MEWMTAGSGHGSGSSRASGDGPELPERYRLPYLAGYREMLRAEKYGLALDSEEDGSFYRGFGGKAWPPTPLLRPAGPAKRCDWYDEEPGEAPVPPTLSDVVDEGDALFALEGEGGELWGVHAELAVEEIEAYRRPEPRRAEQEVVAEVMEPAADGEAFADLMDDRWFGTAPSACARQGSQDGTGLGAGLARAGRALSSLFRW